MALTPQEQEELRQLRAEQAHADDEDEGFQHLDRMAEARTPPASSSETRPFSLYRVTVGGVRDAIQNVVDTVGAVGSAVSSATHAVEDIAGSAVAGGIRRGLDTIGIGHVLDAAEAVNTIKPELPTLKGEEHAGTAERFLRGVTSYMVPFTAFSKSFGAFKATGWLGRAGRFMAAGAATDMLSDPAEANLANTIRDTFGIDNELLDSLASDPDDDGVVARFKAAAVNAPVNLLTDAVMEGGVQAFKAYRAWRGSLAEADAAVKAARADMPVMSVSAADEGAEAGAEAGAKSGKRSKAAPEPEMRISPEEHPENAEDILAFLQRKSQLGDMDPELLSKLALNLVDGNPENALMKMGLDPLKVDFSALDDPAALQRFTDGLRDVYEGIAKRLGRTGIRVTEEQTHMAARVLATSADVLKDLNEATEGLAETFMGSRLFVGTHASKLLSEAKTAMKAIEAGDGEAEWWKFLESFQRHAFFLGALRGAGSEVARALRSLKTIAKVGQKTAMRDAEQAAKNAKVEQKVPEAAQQAAEEARETIAKMMSPAERTLFLSNLIEREGDIGSMSRLVRAKSGSVLKRLDTALGETRGNLFSSLTAIANAGAAGAMIGLNTTAKLLATASRMALAPFSKEMAQQARVQAMQTWAYVDGAFGGWRTAFTNVVSLMEREGMTEVALNLDTLGAKKAAGKAAAMAAEGSARMGRNNFERVDINARDRAFAMTASDVRYLHELIESWPTPKLMDHALKWMVNATAPAVNAAGSLTRLGTILFINSPDQLMGTVAAKAGAQEQAVRLAAQEAAEAGLEGKALSDYLKARMVQLTETVDGFADDAYSAGQQEVALAHGHAEARMALFQDDIEFGPLRALVHGLGQVPLVHLFVPFVKTPLRIMERTVLDFTPLGLAKDRLRADLMAGGARRDEALARVALGTLAVYTAFSLADERVIIGSDGSYKSSARTSRPSFSIQFGDDHIEVSKIDPFGTLLGWGADLKAYLHHAGEDPEAGDIGSQIISAAAVATSANILNKTWFESLRDLVELSKDSGSPDAWSKFAARYTARLTPGSGIQRSVSRMVDPHVHDANGVIEGLMRSSLGASSLPVKRDAFGRPITVESGERLSGLDVGPGASEVDSPLLKELEHLSFDIPLPSRTIAGVRLTTPQFNHWLELRGQVVKKPTTGLTMWEALGELIKLPEYQQSNDKARVEMMREEMGGYSALATEQLLKEDNDFAFRTARKQTWDAELLKNGTTRESRDAAAMKFAKELGITPH